MLSRALYHFNRMTGVAWRRMGLAVATRYHHVTLGDVGKGTRFQRAAHFHPAKQVSFGKDCYVWHGVSASSESTTGALRAGDRVQINRGVHLDMTGGITIGDDVMLSEDVVIYTHDHGLDPRSLPVLCPKTIGNGVWVGMRAVVLPGCRQIGAGAVIGAGAIVTKDVPAGAIMAGNPARQISGKPAMQEVA